MKQGIYYIMFLLLLACSSESANDCFQTTGNIIKTEITVDPFTKILVNREIELIIRQGATTKVEIETGENLLNDIVVEVLDGELRLTDNNTCNYVRDYNVTKAYITAPNITNIRSSTQFKVQSENVLTYPNLTLISEDFNMPDTYAVGDFELQINNDQLQVVSNKSSSFYISGQTNSLNINFASGSGRFESASLIVQNVNVFHRGSNDIIVNPQLSLTGELRSTGDLIAVNTPPTVTVEQFYTGQLIFE